MLIASFMSGTLSPVSVDSLTIAVPASCGFHIVKQSRNIRHPETCSQCVVARRLLL
jgi:hypothetical protein